MTASLQPPLTLVIRPAQVADAATLQRICWPDRTLVGVTEFLQRSEKYHAKQRGMGIVAVLDETICGFALLTLWPRTAEISDLIVASAFQGHGIGTALIAYLTATADAMHVVVLEIGVALSNLRALALYRRLGFHDHHTVQIDLGAGPEPVLYLEKNLLIQ